MMQQLMKMKKSQLKDSQRLFSIRQIVRNSLFLLMEVELRRILLLLLKNMLGIFIVLSFCSVEWIEPEKKVKEDKLEEEK